MIRIVIPVLLFIGALAEAGPIMVGASSPVSLSMTAVVHIRTLPYSSTLDVFEYSGGTGVETSAFSLEPPAIPVPERSTITSAVIVFSESVRLSQAVSTLKSVRPVANSGYSAANLATVDPDGNSVVDWVAADGEVRPTWTQSGDLIDLLGLGLGAALKNGAPVPLFGYTSLGAGSAFGSGLNADSYFRLTASYQSVLSAALIMDVNESPVPEPAAWMLCGGFAVLGLGKWVFRR